MHTAFAQRFAQDWIAAWNSHDIDRVLAHYTDDFVMTSPMITQIAHEPSGTLQGKPAVAAYWCKALTLVPNLHFELIATLVGINSITLHYKGAGGRLAAEVFYFNQNQQVVQAVAHYAAAPTHA